MSHAIARERRPPPRHRTATVCPDTLTARELEVLALIASGLTDPEVAVALTVSVATVRTHVRHVRTKLGVRSRAHAVAVAIRAGMIA
jgi:DNA-binding CsgD family transcriptional regulator